MVSDSTKMRKYCRKRILDLFLRLPLHPIPVKTNIHAYEKAHLQRPGVYCREVSCH